MSYTVLARKWRPKNFSELVGQAHVMQALSNALDQQRLHHAYLFTGTRGVGKTTIARIFAKALNCQEGISSKPCGVCETCRSIDEGRFIDLIEVDAASKTKVDDTREILDNVQFAPTQGRYKVYLIDEVHMLSKSSFNALLKTLEEPPEHVKFLLATTDPHKLPITVLSRCLQFNLMRLTQQQIQGHLANVLTQEQIVFEDAALALIAKSADGSARDSLSLLDQAIAYGAGEVMFDAVQTMLGLVDQQFGVAILQALVDDDAQRVKTVIQQLATMGVDYQALLSQLIESLHAISYVQAFSDNESTTLLPADIVQEFASRFHPERVQLLYQIALLTKQDMQLAPDIRIGFEMALMRMLAFHPAQSLSTDTQNPQTLNSSMAPTNSQSSMANVSSTANAEAEISPQDVLSSLATARSLVGKKKSQISSDNAGSPANIDEKSFVEADQFIAGSEESHQEHNQSLDKQPAQPLEQTVVAQHNEPEWNHSQTEEQITTAVNESYSDSSYSANVQNESHGTTFANESSTKEPQATLNSDVAEPTAEPTPEPANSASNVTDHLAQIRERLKQPLSTLQGQTAVSAEAASIQTVESESVHQAKIEQMASQTSVAQPTETQENLLNQAHDVTEQAAIIHDNVNAMTSQQVDDTPPWFTEEQGVENEIKPAENHSVEPITDVKSPQNNPSQGFADEHSEPLATENGPLNSNDALLRDESFIPSGNNLEDWIELIQRLELKGMAEDLARNSVLIELNEHKLIISIDPEQQYAKPEMILGQIEAATQNYFGSSMSVEVVTAGEHFTPVKHEQQIEAKKQQQAQASILADEMANLLISTLGMEVISGSIKPI
jgi:DNA polymerase-3 subunit gamma/tau